MKSLLNGRVQLHAGDSLAILPTLEENSVDSCVVDPPYHLTSIVKRFSNGEPAHTKTARDIAALSTPMARHARGFMNQKWDGGDVAFRPETWAAVLRVLKPGGHLVAFAAPKNAHRMICAIEDAGFEIRDQLQWIFSQGFPKSLNVGKVLDVSQERCACDKNLRNMRVGLDSEDALSSGSEQDMFADVQCSADFQSENGPDDSTANAVRLLRGEDLQSALQSRQEREGLLQPIVSGQGPCGTSQALRREHEGETAEAGLWSEEPSLEGRRYLSQEEGQLRIGAIRPLSSASDSNGEDGRLRDGAPAGDGRVGEASSHADGMRSSHRSRAAKQSPPELGALAGQSQSQTRRAWEVCDRCGKPMVPDGLGSHLKPAFEPICLARKPLSEPTIAANVLRWGTGALNIDGCRVESDISEMEGRSGQSTPNIYGGWNGRKQDGPWKPSNIGRWPANVIHDGSEEVVGAFPETAASSESRPRSPDGPAQSTWSLGRTGGVQVGHGDSGSAARFFYTAKADSDDRLGSKHPTVKPLDLIQYLVRLVTPPRGTVLDCFAGTGTTGEAAWRDGFSAILIEREPEYLADIERRMSLALSGPDERARESIKARLVGKPIDAGPLFGALP